MSVVVARIVSNRGWVRLPVVLSGAALTAAAVVMLSVTDATSVLMLILMSSLVLLNVFDRSIPRRTG